MRCPKLGVDRGFDSGLAPQVLIPSGQPGLAMMLWRWEFDQYIRVSNIAEYLGLLQVHALRDICVYILNLGIKTHLAAAACTCSAIPLPHVGLLAVPPMEIHHLDIACSGLQAALYQGRHDPGIGGCGVLIGMVSHADVRLTIHAAILRHELLHAAKKLPGRGRTIVSGSLPRATTKSGGLCRRDVGDSVAASGLLCRPRLPVRREGSGQGLWRWKLRRFAVGGKMSVGFFQTGSQDLLQGQGASSAAACG